MFVIASTGRPLESTCTNVRGGTTNETEVPPPPAVAAGRAAGLGAVVAVGAAVVVVEAGTGAASATGTALTGGLTSTVGPTPGCMATAAPTPATRTNAAPTAPRSVLPLLNTVLPPPDDDSYDVVVRSSIALVLPTLDRSTGPIDGQIFVAMAPMAASDGTHASPDRATPARAFRPIVHMRSSATIACPRRSGGIGRRASLRGWCPTGRGGSSPPSDTFAMSRDIVHTCLGTWFTVWPVAGSPGWGRVVVRG